MIIYKSITELTINDLEYLEAHANNMHALLRNIYACDMSKRRISDIRNELVNTVNFLYQFNINLTNLLK